MADTQTFHQRFLSCVANMSPFNINMGKQDKILVYENRAMDSGKTGSYEVTKQELEEILEKNPNVQATIVSTEGQSYTTVRQKDLYTEEQKECFKSYPNYETNIASVKTKGFSELTILSKKKGTNQK